MVKIPNAQTVPISAARRQSTGQKIAQIMTLMQQIPYGKATDPLFDEVIAWVASLPEADRPEALTSQIASTFGRSIESIDLILKPVNRRIEFDSLVPESGWIHDYVEWTRQTEPPTVFHFFVAATTIGATIGRNIYFDKGAYQVYPNLCVMIVAPTGRCRKTSACNIGTSLYIKTGGSVLADKATPEALIDSLGGTTNATGMIYAPELAAFLGKQKYNEGMVPLLTALLDCPKEYKVKTVGRGEMTLQNVALSALMCSTLDWIQTAIPKDAFGGGFMSRFLFVVQENTPRMFPLPPALDPEVRKSLLARLAKIKNMKKEIKFTPAAHAWYLDWYRTRALQHTNKHYAGYFERKPDHLIRLSIVLNAATAEAEKKGEDLIISDLTLIQAEKILHWMELWLPNTFEEMTSSVAGEDQRKIINILKNVGGSMGHSTLLRRNSSRMNAETFKRAIGTLREAQLVEWDATQKVYTLTPEGWK